MATVTDLLEKTKQLHDLLAGEEFKDHRTNAIEELNHLLNDRQEIIDSLPAAFSDDDKILGKKINELNLFVQDRIEFYMKAIKNDLTLTRKKRQMTEKYIKPYQNISRDGMFLDKRK